MPIVMDEPSRMPLGDNSQADVYVALGLLIESNRMWVSPCSLGLAVRELNSMLTAIANPTWSVMGMGPCGGIGGVIPNILQF